MDTLSSTDFMKVQLAIIKLTHMIKIGGDKEYKEKRIALLKDKKIQEYKMTQGQHYSELMAKVTNITK